MIEKNIVIDLWEKYQEKIHVVQNEILGRSIEFQLVSKGLAVNLTDCTVTFYAVKSDGTIVFNACSLVDAARGKVKYTFTAQTVVASGDLSCSLVIVDGSANEIRTQPFAIEVVASPDYTSAVESTSEYTALDTALARVAVNESDISDIDTAIGARTYTENNYVTDNESVTDSIDALDTNLNLVQSDIDSHEALKSPHGVAPVELWTGSHFTNSASITLSESFKNFHFVIVVFALSASDQAWISNQLFSDLVALLTPQATYYGTGNITFNFPSNTSLNPLSGLSSSVRLRKVYGLLRK